MKSKDKRRYEQQVKTYLKRHGREGYARSGSTGGKRSPTKFNSETARLAGQKSLEVRRLKKLAERKKTNENRLPDHRRGEG